MTAPAWHMLLDVFGKQLPCAAVQMRASVRNKKQALLAELRALPDMCLTLSWQVRRGGDGWGALAGHPVQALTAAAARTAFGGA